MKDRKEKMLELRGRGYTLREIGELHGISRERVRKIIGNTGRITQAGPWVYPDEYRFCHRCKVVLPKEEFRTEKAVTCIKCTQEKQVEIEGVDKKLGIV